MIPSNRTKQIALRRDSRLPFNMQALEVCSGKLHIDGQRNNRQDWAICSGPLSRPESGVIHRGKFMCVQCSDIPKAEESEADLGGRESLSSPTGGATKNPQESCADFLRRSPFFTRVYLFGGTQDLEAKLESHGQN